MQKFEPINDLNRDKYPNREILNILFKDSMFDHDIIDVPYISGDTIFVYISGSLSVKVLYKKIDQYNEIVNSLNRNIIINKLLN